MTTTAVLSSCIASPLYTDWTVVPLDMSAASPSHTACVAFHISDVHSTHTAYIASQHTLSPVLQSKLISHSAASDISHAANHSCVLPSCTGLLRHMWNLSLLLATACLVVLCVTPHSVSSLSNGLARLPPMGWSTWNTFRCDTALQRATRDSHADNPCPQPARSAATDIPLPLSPMRCCRCDYTESDLRGVAATLVSSGMAAAGYTSLNIDDCWEAEERTADGQLTYNTTKFPSGLKAFGDYVHSLNLTFGLYTSSGPYTCQEYPGTHRL